MSTKEELRAVMRARRRGLSPDVRKQAAASLCAKLLRLDAVKNARVLAVYLATPQELDLAPLVAALRDSPVRLVAPRWNGCAYELAEWASKDGGELRPGPMSILEPPSTARGVSPSAVDAWIIPGLAFTREGARLGYGGGWYDRLLAESAPEAARIGVGYDFQVVEELPLEPHDSRLTQVVAVASK